MTIDVFQAAKYVCERSSWTVSNLKLQKIIYMAQMVYMGRHGERLIDETFEAWDYGPVSSALYHRVKPFGAGPVGNVFHGVPPISDRRAESLLDEACNHLLKKSPSELVAITHNSEGAWAKNYRSGILGIKISDADIKAEYDARARTSRIQ